MRRFGRITYQSPPNVSDLLMRRNDQIATGPGRQITDERRFDVDPFHHVGNHSQDGSLSVMLPEKNVTPR
jgi:hypothetical protein